MMQPSSSIKDVSPLAQDEEKRRPALKLDKHGLPLVPQPSDHPDDPLVCKIEYRESNGPNLDQNKPYGLKVYTVILVSAIAFVCIS